jgi:hypothetical protein
VSPIRRIAIAGLFAAVLGLAACGGGGGGEPAAPLVPTSITIDGATPFSISSGSTLQLPATVHDQHGDAMTGQTVSWASSDPARASVSTAGVVTGLLIGTSSITATSGAVTSSPVVVTVTLGPASKVVKQRDIAAGLGVTASDSIAIVVTDAGGNPVPGIGVSFTPGANSGTVSAQAAVSGSDGVTGVRWTLGTVASQQVVTAAIPGTAAIVTFSTVPIAGPAAAITKASTDPASAVSGSNVDSIAAKVVDQFGNGKAGETVTFAVTAGGGSVSPTSVVSGADGRAAARWTIGSGAGTNTATATRAGFTPSTVTFTTTATPVGSVVITGPRIIVVDSGGTVTIPATARDAANNVVAGSPITYVSRTGAATVSNGVVTAAQLGTTFIVATSAVNAAAHDSLMVIVADPGAPALITDLSRLDLKADTTFSVTVVLDTRAFPGKLGSGSVQITWPTTLLTYQSDADGSSGVAATENTATTGFGSLTLTFANSTGFGGAVQLRTLTFRATTTVGRTGTLGLAIADMSSTLSGGVATDLRPITVGALYTLVIR